MKKTERIKIQTVINKILSGNFNEIDIDNLFIKLREYSFGFPLFKEVADFVVHNNERDKGLTTHTLTYLFLVSYF